MPQLLAPNYLRGMLVVEGLSSITLRAGDLFDLR